MVAASLNDDCYQALYPNEFAMKWRLGSFIRNLGYKNIMILNVVGTLGPVIPQAIKVKEDYYELIYNNCIVRIPQREMEKLFFWQY